MALESTSRVTHNHGENGPGSRDFRSCSIQMQLFTIPPHAALSLPKAEKVMDKSNFLGGQDESFASG